MPIQRAPRNRTLALNDLERDFFRQKLIRADLAGLDECLNTTVLGDSTQILPLLDSASVDLIIADPPYNLTKSFQGSTFDQRPSIEYEAWLDSWIPQLHRVLKSEGTLYVCSEWRSSSSVQRILEKYFVVRNRITWEREKGRGAQHNWKNCHEDIWFCTASDKYAFDVDAVKQRRQVIAPYRDRNGKPKDWSEEAGGNFRITHPSNLWTDISVPFWSMPENTDHPTQKPEKLIAKLILASSNVGDVVLDPFLGSGTTSVVAKKLGRRFIGIEIQEEYCLLAEKRLAATLSDREIQGYSGGYFWDRNTLALQNKHQQSSVDPPAEQPAAPNLFEGI